jgi:hypothetical protein
MAVPTGIEPAISCVTGRHVNRYTTGPYKVRWWRMTGSNRRPPACKAGALPAELILRNINGDPYGIRTRVTAVKGRCLNRLTNGPYVWQRRRDSNPRTALTIYTLSRGAPWATWVLLYNNGSAGRIRTYDHSVNSRVLYHWATAE